MHRIGPIVHAHFPEHSIEGATPIAGDLSSVSGSTVMKVTIVKGEERKHLAVKFGKNIAAEVRGYRAHCESLLTGRLPRIFHSKANYLVMEYIENLGTFEDAVRQGGDSAISSKLLQDIFEELLTLKEELWSRFNEQDGVTSGLRVDPSSIIRTEFPSTLAKIEQIFAGSDLTKRIILKRHGQAPKPLPPLSVALGYLSEFLNERENLFRVLSHGDLKGDNVLITKDGWRILDLEWSGLVDWPEALTRLGKWHSSKTSQLDLDSVQVSPTNVEMTLSYRIEYPELCVNLQTMAYKLGRKFSVGVGDKDWWRRWYYYMGASLLREITLLDKRRLPSQFSIPLLGEAVRAISYAHDSNRGTTQFFGLGAKA